MKRCPQCNRLYSDMTEKCPQCGILLSAGGAVNNNGGNVGQQPQNNYGAAQNSYQQPQNDYSAAQNNYQQPQNTYRNPNEDYRPNGNNAPQSSPTMQYSNGKMGFGEAISTCFGKYATFSGRASKAEFWWFYLFTLLISWAAQIIVNFNVLIGLIIMVAVDVPFLAVSWRRAHDVGKCGAFMLIPLYNLILALKKGDDFYNQYGDVPVK